MHTLGYFMRQTWRSIVSFFLSFVVLGLMVWFTPDWVSGFVEAAGMFKYLFLDQAAEVTGLSSGSALVSLLVSDNAIALALMTLFTRVVVLTILLWIGGMIYRSLFGARS